MLNLNFTPAVKQIFIGCVVLFIGDWLLASRGIDLSNILGLHYLRSDAFRFWQPLTNMFMHGGFIHLAMNMLVLIMFGNLLESVLGTRKFVILYFVSGFGSFFLHEAMDIYRMYKISGLFLPDLKDLMIEFKDADTFSYNSLMFNAGQAKELVSIYSTVAVGASGALYGVLASFAFFFPNTDLYLMFIPVPIKAKYLIPGFLIVDLYLGISQYSWDPVAHFAHIGGGLAGLILVWYWRKFDKRTFW